MRWVVALTALSVTLSGCGETDERTPSRIPAPRITQLPDQARVRIPDRALVPNETPDDLTLRVAARRYAGFTEHGSTVLYGTNEEPEAFVAVGFIRGGENAPYLSGFVRTFGNPVRAGDHAAIAWETRPAGNGTQESDQIVVIGHNVSSDAVEKMAESVVSDPERMRARAEWLPTGFAEATAGPLSVGAVSNGFPLLGTTVLEWHGPDNARLRVTSVASDAVLETLLGAIVDPMTHTALVPPMHGEAATLRVLTTEKVLALVQAQGIPSDELDSLVSSLHVEREGEWSSLEREAAAGLATIDATADQQTFGAAIPGGGWTATLEVSDGRLFGSIFLGTIDEHAFAHLDVSWRPEYGMFVGAVGYEDGVVMGVVAPRVVSRLEYVSGDATVNAELRDVDPTWPVRIAVRWSPHDLPVDRILAYDAGGHLIADHAIGWPSSRTGGGGPVPLDVPP